MQTMIVTQHRGKKLRTYRQWCTYCKSHFMTQSFKPYSRRVTCGQPACQIAHNRFINNEIRWQKQENRQTANSKPERKIITKTCPYCKRAFDFVNKRRVTCGQPKCKKKRAIEYIFNKKLIVKNCAICDKQFKCMGDRRVTCGRPKCVKQRSRNTRYQKLLMTKSCVFCGKVFDCLGPGRVTCGLEQCQTKLKRAWHKAPENKSRLKHYKERHRAKLLMHKELKRLAGL